MYIRQRWSELSCTCTFKSSKMNYTDREKNEFLNGSAKIEDNHGSIETSVVIICVLNAPLMLTSIAGNILVLTAIKRTPSIRSRSITMLCSLAVSDLLVGFIAQPFFLASLLTRVYVIERMSKITAFCLCGVSLCTMTAISTDRFLALQYPMRYQATVTANQRALNTLVVIIWLGNFVFSGFYIWNWPLYFIMIATGVCLFILVSTFCYIRIYRIVRHHQIQIRAQQQAAQQNTKDGDNSNMVRMKRSALNTFIFYIAMILCYFPIIISLCVAGITSKNLPEVWHLADTVVFLNSTVNPLLYCWRLGEIREAVLKILRQMSRRQADQP